MKYVECPNHYDGDKASLFLAGGISNCPDWQHDLTDLLKDENLVIINPRRNNFSIENKSMSKEQIEWEHQYLTKSDGISFWFPKETLCPITLYELGTWSKTDKPLMIGLHPDYERKFDVEIQTYLARPDIDIVYDLESLASQIKDWIYR